jgi:hypothetical protein
MCLYIMKNLQYYYVYLIQNDEYFVIIITLTSRNLYFLKLDIAKIKKKAIIIKRYFNIARLVEQSFIFIYIYSCS